jgi:hypothetical protein
MVSRAQANPKIELLTPHVVEEVLGENGHRDPADEQRPARFDVEAQGLSRSVTTRTRSSSSTSSTTTRTAT